MLEVVEAGLLTTIQDLGRPGWGGLGVPEGGAADPWSHRIANRLVGNDEDAATIEITFAGPRLRALQPTIVALAGADLGASIARGHAVRLSEGEELRIPGPAVGSGARAYLAVAGGIDLPEVLGSRSTCLAGGFGGVDGRPLREGDRLLAGAPAVPRSRTAREATLRPRAAPWPADPIAPQRRDPDGTALLRALPGLHGALPDATFRVGAASDRMGLRLEPADARDASRATPLAHVTSHGVVRGAVQLPPDGRPIVLMADHQPTGGYPVVAVVIAADLAALGQLAPGDRVRFEPVDRRTARAALDDQRATWALALAHLRSDDTWDELWHSAGA